MTNLRYFWINHSLIPYSSEASAIAEQHYPEVDGMEALALRDCMAAQDIEVSREPRF